MNDREETRAQILDVAVGVLGASGLSGVVPVTGISMRPTLQDGDRVLGEFHPQEPRHGDVLLFRQDGLLVVHRLIGRQGHRAGKPRLLTRGDGRLLPDPLVDRDRVLGIVVAAERQGEWHGLRGRGARVYGWMLAWHARFWSGVGAVACWFQEVVARTGIRLPLRSLVWRIDQRLLRIADAALFRIVHPRVDPPSSA